MTESDIINEIASLKKSIRELQQMHVPNMRIGRTSTDLGFGTVLSACWLCDGTCRICGITHKDRHDPTDVAPCHLGEVNE